MINYADPKYTKLDALQQECHRIAKDHGWWEDWDRNIPEQLMLMVSELGEALEELRNNNNDPTVLYYTGPKNDKPEGFGVELADVCIRIFDTCERYNISLIDIIREKMEYNETRPYRHGGKSA